MGYLFYGCLLVSLAACVNALIEYRRDQRYTNTCIDSMIEKIEELEAKEIGQNNG